MGREKLTNCVDELSKRAYRENDTEAMVCPLSHVPHRTWG